MKSTSQPNLLWPPQLSRGSQSTRRRQKNLRRVCLIQLSPRPLTRPVNCTTSSSHICLSLQLPCPTINTCKTRQFAKFWPWRAQMDYLFRSDLPTTIMRHRQRPEPFLLAQMGFPYRKTRFFIQFCIRVGQISPRKPVSETHPVPSNSCKTRP